MRPMIGNVGTVPSVDMPSSNNCGDFGQSDHYAEVFGITAEQLAEARTDAHMDIDSVRAGSVLICPVKVPEEASLPVTYMLFKETAKLLSAHLMWRHGGGNCRYY